jgi:hypothetical protein
MTGSDEDRGRSRRLGAEDRRWSSTCWVLSGRAIGRSGSVSCTLRLKNKVDGFLVWDSKSVALVW